MRNHQLYATLVVFGCAFPFLGFSATADDLEEATFFESRVRPALVQYCQECHAVDTDSNGGLVLDSKVGWLAGGDSGVSIVPGDAAASRLFRAISYEDSNLQMPPDGRLPAEVIADFKRWIDRGAYDPRVAEGGLPGKRQAGLPVERATDHWAYRPVVRPMIPRPGSTDWVADSQPLSPIDHFISHRLEEAGLVAAPEAERESLLRRLCFDLTGLPPTSSQMQAFQADTTDDGYRRMVEQLLASPRFGESFARRWMDVVRYADSITLRGFVLPQAWRYRDYLIDAFAQDRSFALMVEEQLAGDLMQAQAPEERARQLVATSFWALGNTNLEQQDKTQLEMDYIDEQLEVMGRAFLGQTLGCARCHDHKFDPIPTRDYYALAGIMRSAVGLEHENVSKWIEQPLPLVEEHELQFAALTADRAGVVAEVERLKRIVNLSAAQDKRLIPVDELPGVVVDSRQAKLVGQWVTSSSVGPIVGDSYIHDNNSDKGEKSATLAPVALPPGDYEVLLAYSSDANRASNLIVTVFSADGETSVPVNQRQKATERGVWVSLGSYRFEQDGQAFVMISNKETDGYVIVDAVQFLPKTEGQAATVAVGASVAAETAGSADELKQATDRLAELEEFQKSIDLQLAERPRYLALVERNQPVDIPIHIRGDVHNLGAVVPRGFLTALTHASPRLHSEANGRHELARWVCADENPLTARVYANRVWAWLMGQGLVSTVDNFGTTGAAPTHPELLDWLALRLIDHGWSTKDLVREIVNSQAYRRAIIAPTAAALDSDPDNRLYWRGHPRRLSVEALRDAMLLISGELDLTMGGSLIPNQLSSDYNYVHTATRRSVYQPVFRNSLPQLFEAFDFANSSISTGQRPRSTVATQALVLMNHPWVIARAAQAAEYSSALNNNSESGNAESNALAAQRRIGWLYQQCFGRSATDEELRLAQDFIDARHGEHRADESASWQQLIQMMFASLDFRYLD